MKLYPVYFALAAFTVFSPGPGVLMTLTNSLCYGLKGAFGGILGISCGALAVAGISATGLGVVLAGSDLAFTITKYIGAAYLVYLGIRLWRSPAFIFREQAVHEAGFRRNFIKGMLLQFTNPKAIFFFLSVLPQFIDRDMNFTLQFTLMAATYGVLIIVIHSLYALGAQQTRVWLTSEAGGRAINRLGGALFLCFGLLLAVAGR
ncbi:LysE family translocator [Geobacter sp. SVR]|uniref:LysE family translocator n=1 Tax=Geobacter sp. SVR TaxID=2495594 RepID=UPI00143EFF98|nr:LysE family translocator [Geobacter sp. SVR]BCS51715.1 flagellar biosynthesis protein FlgM [Geobacter sp. SVR]GCF84902.1 flagellar biosynthesis protein FlgM [Geobacter sp. SVR]